MWEAKGIGTGLNKLHRNNKPGKKRVGAATQGREPAAHFHNESPAVNKSWFLPSCVWGAVSLWRVCWGGWVWQMFNHQLWEKQERQKGKDGGRKFWFVVFPNFPSQLQDTLSHQVEKGMVTHSSILAWRIPSTEEPGRLQSMVSQRVGYNWVTNTHTHTHTHTSPNLALWRDDQCELWASVNREKWCFIQNPPIP